MDIPESSIITLRLKARNARVEMPKGLRYNDAEDIRRNGRAHKHSITSTPCLLIIGARYYGVTPQHL